MGQATNGTYFTTWPFVPCNLEPVAHIESAGGHRCGEKQGERLVVSLHAYSGLVVYCRRTPALAPLPSQPVVTKCQSHVSI